MIQAFWVGFREGVSGFITGASEGLGAFVSGFEEGESRLFAPFGAVLRRRSRRDAARRVNAR
jgi:hypothetical protein